MNSNALNPEVTKLDIQNTVFSDKFSSLIGRQATQEEINALSEEDKQDIETRYQYTKEYQKQEAIDTQYAEEVRNDPNSIFYKQGELNTNISTTIDEGFGRSKEASYRRAKQIMHDYAKLSSAEQAIIDQRNRAQAIERDRTMLTPQEARSLGGEYGVELKYDKNVARGEVMFTIGRNIYKKDLEKQLAMYKADQDFSAIQNIGMFASAISGGVGFYETAATVALGFFLPEVALATVANVGRAGMVGANVMKGVDLAYKTQRATKIATKSANMTKMLNGLTSAETMKEAETALKLFSKSQKINTQVSSALKNASETTRLAYNLSNLALRAPGAEQAFTLGQRTMLSAGDALISSVPAMMASGYNSIKNQDEMYTAKNCAIESLLALGIGAAIPSLGVAFGKALSLGGNAFTNLKTHISKQVDNYHYKNVIEGVPDNGIIDAASRATKDLDIAADNIKKPSPDFVKTIREFEQTNMTEEEFLANFQYVAQKLSEGEVPNLSLLPHKSALLSHVSSDIVDSIKNNIFDLSERASKALKINKVGRMFTASLDGETGLLGKASVMCYSEDQAKRMLSDIYKATLDNDFDAYVRVASFVEQQYSLADELRALIGRAQELKQFNKLHKGTDKAKTLSMQEDFKSTLADLLGKLKYGDTYDRLIQLRKQKDVDRVLSGITLDNTYSEEVSLINSVIDEMLKEAEEMGSVKTLRQGEKVFNPNLEKLQELADQLDTSSSDLISLVDTPDILRTKYGSPDEIIEAINSHTIYQDTDLQQLFGMPRVTSDDLKARMKEVDTQQQLLDIENQRWAANQEGDEFWEIEQAVAARDKNIQGKNSGELKGDTFFSQSKRAIENIDQFLSEGINAIRTSLQQVIDLPEFQKYLANALAKSAEGKLDNILRKNVTMVRNLIDTYVGEPLGKLGIAIDDSDVMDLADRFIDMLESGKAKKLSNGFGDKIIDKSLPSDIAAENATQLIQKTSAVDELIDPLLVEVQKLALNKKLQYTRSLNIITEQAKELMRNPFVPGEVITKLFTFSPYNLKDANRNVENIIRNSQAYVRDIETELMRKSSGTTATEKLLDGGINLVDYMHNPENRRGILTAMVYMDAYGSADAAKKAGVPFNANDAVVAQVIRDRYATLLNNLHNVGSMKQKIGSRLNASKLRQAEQFIPETAVSNVATRFEALTPLSKDIVDKNTKYKLLGQEIDGTKFVEQYNKGVSKLKQSYMRLIGNTNNERVAALFAFNNFDLDKMFNARGISRTSFNEARDALVSGELKKIAENNLDDFNDMVSAIDKIVDAFIGVPSSKTKTGKDTYRRGWVYQYIHGGDDFDTIKHNLSNRYVAKFNNSIEFKNPEAEIKALSYLGYDSIRDQLNHDFETGQRAYAILKVAGSEPMKLAEDLMDIHNAYVERHAADLFRGKVEDAKISWTARNSIRANAAMATGADMAASRTITRLVKAVADIVTSPLLVNAGFRSLSDYTYQQEWMILSGLAESKNLFGWAKGVSSAVDLMKDPELRRLVGYNQFLTQEALLRMRTNVDTDSIGSIVGKFKSVPEMVKAISDGKGTGIDKLERFAKAFSTFMINDFGIVDKFTQIHRSSAAVTLMRAISEQAENSFESLAKNKGLVGLLKRHGIEEADWEFLRKHCNIEFAEYLGKQGIDRSTIDNNFKMFIPDNLLNVSDDVFKAELKNRGLDSTNEIVLSNFRNEIYEKASILINSGADEMTTLPTYRTTNAMSFGVRKGSGLGQFIGALTKFQSFGMACTQIHFGRRIAQYCDTEDVANVQTIWRSLLGMGGGTEKAYGQLAHLVMCTAMAQFMIDYALDTAKGQQQSMLNEKGKLNVGKIVDPIIDASGILSPILDGTVGKIAQGNMTTSGFQINAFPAASTAWRYATKLAKPWFDEEADFGEKLSRTGAAAANISTSSLNSSALTSLVWRHALGGWLEEQERGAENYRRYIKSKKREGYAVNQRFSRFQTDPSILFGLID